MKETALYIHIPFCEHKCIYCDFYSIISFENTEKYLDAMFKEIDFYSSLYAQKRIYTSIFFGGGTPSLMAPAYIEKIISKLKNSFTVSDDVEVTLETNPGTVSYQKLIDFRKAGINRLSVGVQSFHEEDLIFLTRIHTNEEAIKCFYDAVDAGFNNINIDLIFNLPGQSKEKWIYNLNKAFGLPVTHISSYSLILERGTILNKMVLDGKVKIADEDFDAELYSITMQLMEKHNFKQYEVSNFAKDGYQCKHNLAYWTYKDYLSFGTSSHSFMENKRWWNFSSLKMYMDSVNKNSHAKSSLENLSIADNKREYTMLALRSTGLNLKEYQQKFNEDFFTKKKSLLNDLIKNEYAHFQDHQLILTQKGFPLADEIILKLID
ncbi:MAG TPA: radical SAM family heme chaperone HemW [Ignavibacteriaceae bacterium]|nr:radical SAM family heme chaperone HemW [Ignavibacteriaceae bacterium]